MRITGKTDCYRKFVYRMGEKISMENRICFSDMQIRILECAKFSYRQAASLPEKTTKTHRFMYIFRGGFQVNISGETLELCQGDVFYTPARTKYEIRASEGTEFINVFFQFSSDDAMPMAYYFVEKPDDDFADFSHIPDFSDTDAFRTFRRLPTEQLRGNPFAAIAEEERTRQFGYRLRQTALLTDFLVAFVRERRTETGSAMREKAEEILQYIILHCEEPLDSTLLGKEFHYHASTINRIIRTATGRSVHQYILDTRIARAKTLLQETEMPVTEISYRLGFYDSSHFASVFRKSVGMLPTAYRRSMT